MPDPDMILNAVYKYEQELAAKGVMAQRCDISQPIGADHAKALSHVAWCLGEIQVFVADERLDKANRWLGFVQGALWMLNHNTIDSFRADNSAGQETS